MKFTILGFNQRQAINLGLSLKDLLILRWFVDYHSSGSMIKKRIDDVDYYWVDYDGIRKSIPILNLKTNDAIYRSLKNMASLEILEHKTLKQGGVWSYYRLGKSYIKLIDDCTVTIGKNTEVPGENTEGVGENTEGTGENVGTKNKSIINNNIYSRVVTRLNEMASKNYKHTTRKTQSLINARLSEGFTEEDFYKVIENKVSKWKGTESEMYLRPETLFGNKFEGYLNEKSSYKKENEKIDNEFYPKIDFETWEE